MTINLDNEYQGNWEIDYVKIAHLVIEETLDYEQCPYEAEVSLVMTSNEEIKKINREFRSIDMITDVLSFPLISFPFGADYGIIEELESECFHPDTGELLLGDIMIAVPRMIEQAKTYGHSQTREYAFLITHSTLHLLGYDHTTEEDAGIMEQKQHAILNRLEIKR